MRHALIATGGKVNQNSSTKAHGDSREPYNTPELTLFGKMKELTASGSVAGKEDNGAGGGNRRFA